MDTPPQHCSLRYLVIRPGEIHYLRFLLEAYEGMAIVTTLQPRLGLVRLSIAPGCEQDIESLLRSEQDQLGLSRVDSL
jgi:hypothetical protein